MDNNHESVIQSSIKREEALNNLKKELIAKRLSSEEKFKKNLLDDYEVIGFDVDHTLEVYNMFNFPQLIYSSFAKYLIDYELYPINLDIYNEKIQQQNKLHEKLNFLNIQFFEKLSCTEVLLDLENGNALKIADDLSILKVFHGVKEIKKDVYDNCKYPEHKNFNYNQSLTENYYYVRGYIEFHICALFLFCVELFDLKYLINKSTYKEIFADIYKAFNFNYKLNENTSDCFSLSGYYYPEIRLRTSYFLNEELNKDEKLCVRRTMENLKNKGKRLFFATNSFFYYADMVMKTSLGDDYKDLFDLCFYFAKKPYYFNKENGNHFTINGDSRKYTLEDFEKNDDLFEKMKSEKIIIGGSYRIVEAFFKKLDSISITDLIKSKPILYVGDNFSNDCYLPTKNEGWKTVAIDETLETGYIGRRNKTLCEFWKLSPEDEIRDYRYKMIRDNVEIALTNVQLLDYFL